jgi:hypothetical protein
LENSTLIELIETWIARLERFAMRPSLAKATSPIAVSSDSIVITTRFGRRQQRSASCAERQQRLASTVYG